MSIVLFRVDERLIHGQVVVGWGTRLHPDRIVVVDDVLAAASWEQELYTFGLPGEVDASFETVDSARALLPEWRSGTDKLIVLTRDVATMRRLAAGGALRGDEVNIGGLHHAPGRVPVLPYVYLSPEETSALRALVADGVDVSARDVPSSRRVTVDEILRDAAR